MKRNRSKQILLILPFVLIMALVLVSVFNVLIESLGYIPPFGLTKLTFGYYARALSDRNFLSALGVSLHIAVMSAVLSTVLGTVLCAALVRRNRKNGAALYLVRLPILVPHAVVAVFVIALLSQTGLIARLAYAIGLIGDYTEFPQLLYTKSYAGAILAYLWKEIPFVAYFTLSLMSSISSTLGEAAQNMGATPLKSFFQVTLPLSLPAILKAFLIIFIFAFGGYELPFLLGVTIPKALPVQAYLSYMDPNLLQRPYAMAMNAVLLLLSAGIAILYFVLTKRLTRRLGGAE